MLRSVHEKSFESDQIFNQPDWEIDYEDKKKGFIQYKKVTDQGTRAFKIEFFSNYPMNEFTEIFSDMEFFMKMNDKVKSLDIVETIVPNQTWIYLHIPMKIPFVDARETVYIRHI